jgi:hypothetical protein
LTVIDDFFSSLAEETNRDAAGQHHVLFSFPYLISITRIDASGRRGIIEENFNARSPGLEERRMAEIEGSHTETYADRNEPAGRGRSTEKGRKVEAETVAGRLAALFISSCTFSIALLRNTHTLDTNDQKET